MKIGTLSLNINTDDLNFGAILHTWAFQQQLLKLDEIDVVEVINYIPIGLEKFEHNKPILSYLKLKRWKSAVKIILSRKQYLKRLQKFKNFTESQLIISAKQYTQEDLKNAELIYDCVICESDVIWSPNFFGGKFDETFFLALESMKDKKKIAYAPSMANGMPPYLLNRFQELIMVPDFVSCRESYSVNFIEKNTSRKATHVVDPVLLLDPEDYDKICIPKFIKKDYLLLYIPLDYDKRYQKAAEKYAQQNNLELIEISYYVWHGKKHKVMADIGIEEFLTLIRDASVIFTNSFHAVCFALLYNKEFYAFSRTTGKKIEDICSIVGLRERYMDIDKFQEGSPIPYEDVNKKIKNMKEKSFEWLKTAIQTTIV